MDNTPRSVLLCLSPREERVFLGKQLHLTGENQLRLLRQNDHTFVGDYRVAGQPLRTKRQQRLQPLRAAAR